MHMRGQLWYALRAVRMLPSCTKGGFYRKLAAYGHVGRVDLELPWEVTDKVEVFKEHRN